MPDLTEQVYFYCTQHESHVATIRGYIQKYVIAGELRGQRTLRCSCKGFQYTRKCRHLEEARKEFCSWHEAIYSGGASSADDMFNPRWREETCCPLCGSNIRAERWAT